MDLNHKTPTVALTTLGCKTNRFESAAMEERLRDAGYRIIPFEKGAELVIVNTCTVTAATDSQSRNLIRRARRLHPDCRVVVTGCYAQIDPERLRKMEGVSLVIGNDEKKELLEILLDDRGSDIQVSDIRRKEKAAVPPLSSFSGRSRAFLQIQNGCDAFCSYCIIPYARGVSRSVPPDEVLAQMKRMIAAGYPEIILTGIHIGGYGKDLDQPLTLLDLLRRIERDSTVSRLRLGSLEPTEIPDALIEHVAGSAVCCPHFHIPLQSGDDAVLARMNRHYGATFFRERILKIRDRLPDAAIGLDVIAGFPGETEEEFEKSRLLMEYLPLTYLHVFPFSRRPGTPAAEMAGQLPGNVIRARAAALREIGERKKELFAGTFLGRELLVVVEEKKGPGAHRGLSPHYLPVLFEGKKEVAGRTVAVQVEDWNGSELVGRMV